MTGPAMRGDDARGEEDRDTPDGPVKVVDRRRWAHGEPAEADAPQLRPSYVAELERLLAEKDKAIQAHAARYRESAGEFEQVRARMRRDVEREVERGRRLVLGDLLEVVDNLERAIAAGRADPAAGPALLKGVELVRDHLLGKLSTYGVRPMAADNAPFDPAQHDALSIVRVADPALDDRVVATVRAGYLIGSEVLRPAGVVVGRVSEDGGV